MHGKEKKEKEVKYLPLPTLTVLDDSTYKTTEGGFFILYLLDVPWLL